MKKLLFIIALFAGSLCFTAQAEQAKVKLKSGVEITGTVISMDPTDSIVLEIAGKQCTIKMGDVESIEQIVETAPAAAAAPAPAATTSADNSLPKEKIVNIAGHDMKFILVPHNTFNYGYDGPGSRVIDSEPVHEVEISAFYVSEDPVSVELAKDILGSDPWSEYTWKINEDGYKYWTKLGIDLPQDKDTDNLKKVALFYPSFSKYEIQNDYGKLGKEGESFPSAKAFISALQQKAGNEFKILNEVQYASLIKQDISDVKFPIIPEVMMSINMSDRKDPSPDKFMTKGLDMIVYPGAWRSNVKINKLDYRASLGIHDLNKKKKELSLYKYGMGHMVAPLHLVLPAK